MTCTEYLLAPVLGYSGVRSDQSSARAITRRDNRSNECFEQLTAPYILHMASEGTDYSVPALKPHSKSGTPLFGSECLAAANLRRRLG